MKVKLRELGEIVTGNTPSKQVTEFWDSDDICFVKPDTISDTGISTILSSAEHLAEAARSKARVVGNDAVLVTCIGSIGKIGITGQGEFAFNQQINAIIPNRRVNPKYLAYALVFAKPQLIAIANAPVVPIINKSQFGDFEINIIEGLQKQAEVARTLDIVAGVISKRQQQLSTLNDLIKARFVEMFGNPFDIGNPAKWPQKPIRQIAASISDGSNVDKAIYKRHGDVLFLRIQNVWCNEFRLEDSVYISKDENAEYKDTSLKHGDLLITKIGRYYTSDSSLGRVSVYLGDDDKANYSNNIMRIRFTDVVNSEFVNALMNLDDYNRFIRKTSVGGTDKRALSKSLIAEYPIVVPPINKQNEFVDSIHQIDKSKSVIQKTLDETQILFDSLMQKYFG